MFSTSTRDTKEAAALQTLGVPLRIEKSVDAKTGDRYSLFFLGIEAFDGQHLTSTLRRLYREPDFAKSTPAHPFLACKFALRARERLLAILKGEKFHLVHEVGQFWQFAASSSGLPGLDTAPACVGTNCLDMASALSALGHEIYAIDGPADQRRFILANASRNQIAPTAADLIARYRSRDLAEADPENPLLYAIIALKNHRTLLRNLEDQPDMVLLRKPRSAKFVSIRADASDKAWQKAQDFFAL